MGKNIKQPLMFVTIFTALLLTYSCTKEEDKGNQPPETPSNFSPANNDTNISVWPRLAWSPCSDPENDSVTYDIYLGKTNQPPLVKSKNLLNFYNPETLLANTKYYWKVVAKDNKNNSASSPLWNFTTITLPDPGDIQVIVCDITQTNYYGGAEVFLYRSESDSRLDPQRTSYYLKAITDYSDPVSNGAVFYALPYQKYFFYCRKDLGGGNFLNGFAEFFVKSGIIVTLVIVVW